MEQTSLYRRVFGEQFQQLHPLLQKFHDRPEGKGEGVFRIVRPSRLSKRILGSLLGMPAAAENVPTVLTVTALKDAEKWDRLFGNYRMTTWQWAWGDLLLERFGSVTFGIDLKVVEGGMVFTTHRVWLLGIPLPLLVAPRVFAQVSPLAEGWRVQVRLLLPLVGEMLRYEGEIVPHEDRPAPASLPGSAWSV